MKVKDFADPAEWKKHQSLIDGMHARVCDSRRKGSERQALLNRVQYHIGQSDMTDHDWNRVFESLETWNRNGHPVSDSCLLGLLEAHEDFLDRCWSEGTCCSERFAALVEDRIEKSCEDHEPVQASEESIHHDFLQEARAELKGCKRLHLFGGEPKSHVVDRLEAAFDLPVLWTASGAKKKRSDISKLAKREARQKGVFVRIRWRGHKEQEFLKDACRKHAVRIIEVQKGYAPVSIARAILKRNPSEMPVEQEVKS